MTTNGHAPHIAPVAPSVHVGVVQALSDLLARAQRGEIHALLMVAVRGADGATLDTIVCDSMVHALLLAGAGGVVRAKIEQSVIATQQNQPAGRILRASAGMAGGLKA